jgi:hypothetical protein
MIVASACGFVSSCIDIIVALLFTKLSKTDYFRRDYLDFCANPVALTIQVCQINQEAALGVELIDNAVAFPRILAHSVADSYHVF